MADILDFRPPGTRSARRTIGASAEIVIFPGVRYERWDDAPSGGATDRTRDKDKPKGKGRRIKRDTLDLES